jgi:hypothetical protein
VREGRQVAAPILHDRVVRRRELFDSISWLIS